MTRPIPEALIQRQQQAFAGTLPDSCAIIRNAFTETDDGWIGTPTQVGSISCRVTPLTEFERLRAGIEAVDATFVARFPAGTELEDEDQIDWGGIRFNVITPRLRSEERLRTVYLART